MPDNPQAPDAPANAPPPGAPSSPAFTLPAPASQADPQAGRIETLEKRLAELAASLAKLDQFQRSQAAAAQTAHGQLAARVEAFDYDRGVNPFRHTFPARITGLSSAANRYAWAELAASGGSLGLYTGGRAQAAATASGIGAAAEINGWRHLASGSQVVMVEVEDRTAMRYLCVAAVPPPADITKDYLLAYDGTAKKMVWVETTTECP